jgi:hypothetical protein
MTLNTSVAVWYNGGHYDIVDNLSDLAQKIHKMAVSRAELADRKYRLVNRITFVFREGSVGIDPLFELDRMSPGNYSSTPCVYLRMSDEGQWELRDENNDLVDMKALDIAKGVVNYFSDEKEFQQIFSISGIGA